MDTHVRDNFNAILSNATTLNPAVVASSLTSVGTIASGIWNAGAVTSSGLLTVNGFGTHSFSASGDGTENKVIVRNTHANGSTAIGLMNDSEGQSGWLRTFGSTFSTSGPNIAASVLLASDESAGLSLGAFHVSGVIRFYSGGTTLQGNLTTAGAWQNNAGGSWATISDERLKTHIKDLSDVSVLQRLRPRTFEWRNPSAHGGVVGSSGFVAQEVADVVPQWVRPDSEPWGDDQKLITNGPAFTVQLPIGFEALLVSGWQDHEARIRQLEQRLETVR